jgi:hypothetical protein
MMSLNVLAPFDAAKNYASVYEEEVFLHLLLDVFFSVLQLLLNGR